MKHFRQMITWVDMVSVCPPKFYILEVLSPVLWCWVGGTFQNGAWRMVIWSWGTLTSDWCTLTHILDYFLWKYIGVRQSGYLSTHLLLVPLSAVLLLLPPLWCHLPFWCHLFARRLSPEPKRYWCYALKYQVLWTQYASLESAHSQIFCEDNTNWHIAKAHTEDWKQM